MNLLDLFSGIGGFSYAAEKHGFFTSGFCEIDSSRQKVIQKHFPGRPVYNDVRSVRGYDLEPVDVVTFGSPCQDLSIAGKRDGLKGERSSLFFEAIRIIREMRERTNDCYPRYAVWENVPGAFSSNRGQDFRAVLEAFLETEIPMPYSGRWATAGMVRGDGRSVAWRVLDAQYWGVPQRRRRIFLVCDFRGQSAPEVLFESQSVPRDTSESGKERKEITSGIRNSTEVYCLQGSMIGRKDKNGPAGSGINQDICLALNTVDRHAVAYPKVTGTLCASGAGLNRPAGMGSETELLVAQCLTTGTGKRYDPETETLIPVGYTVRRLTPLECLRLQGLPDDWLDGLGLSDSAKYRMIGDSVAIPCVEFVVGNIAVRLLEEGCVTPSP